jgi:hypothetical protein
MKFYLLLLIAFGLPSGLFTKLRTVDIERNIFELEKLLYKDWAFDFKNEDGVCHQILNEFSSAASQFIFCANAFAKPISMCQNCFSHYVNVTNSYQALSDHSESGTSCMDILTSQDRIDIIKETYQFIAATKTRRDDGIDQGMWDKGNCNLCYSQPFSKDSVLSAKTVDFFARHSLVESCFQKFPYQEGIGRNESKACQECQPYYQNLSEFYTDYILQNEITCINHICIDIADAMNMTQRQWGEKYNCGRMVQRHVPLLVMVVCVLCTPIVFYTLVRLAETSAEERVISQRNITNFLDIRRLSFNRRSRFSRTSRQVSREQHYNTLDNTTNNFLTVPTSTE